MYGKGKYPKSTDYKPKASVGKTAANNFEHRFCAGKSQSSKNNGNLHPGRNCSSFEIGMSELGRHIRESMYNSLSEAETVDSGSIANNEYKRARREQCSREPEPSGGLVIPALRLKLTSSCRNECHKHWVIDTEEGQELSGF